MNEVPVEESFFENGFDVMGPLLAGTDGAESFLLAYEHGSQYPDAFIHYCFTPVSYTHLDVYKRQVHRLGVVGVVVFRAGGMEKLVIFFVVGLLEKDIGADAGFLQLPVVFHSRRRNVDVDPADRPVFVLDAVDGLDTLEDILNRVVDRILARLDSEPLVPHILQGYDLSFNLLLGQLFAGDVLVFVVVRAVGAAVDAVVGKVKRGEHCLLYTSRCV